MRVAIYARVSTNGKNGNGRGEQTPENQLLHLREWCSRCGHEVVAEYVEHRSGGKGRGERPEFDRMFQAAHQRRFDMVLCWALDRFSREGMVPTIEHLQRLAAAGVSFHSFTEPMLSTDNEMIRDIVLAVMAGLAKQERLRHVERVHAGLERARQQGTRSGKPIGRAPMAAGIKEAIAADLVAGKGTRATARKFGVGNATVTRIRAELGKEPRLL
jgi:DNA invertase Pin-like site-specific DNA recombinase